MLALYDALEKNICSLERQFSSLYHPVNTSTFQKLNKVSEKITSSCFLENLLDPSLEVSSLAKIHYLRALKASGITERVIEIVETTLKNSAGLSKKVLHAIVKTSFEQEFEVELFKKISTEDALLFVLDQGCPKFFQAYLNQFGEVALRNIIFSKGKFESCNFVQAFLSNLKNHSHFVAPLSFFKVEDFLTPLGSRLYTDTLKELEREDLVSLAEVALKKLMENPQDTVAFDVILATLYPDFEMTLLEKLMSDPELSKCTHPWIKDELLIFQIGEKKKETFSEGKFKGLTVTQAYVLSFNSQEMPDYLGILNDIDTEEWLRVIPEDVSEEFQSYVGYNSLLVALEKHLCIPLEVFKALKIPYRSWESVMQYPSGSRHEGRNALAVLIEDNIPESLNYISIFLSLGHPFLEEFNKIYLWLRVTCGQSIHEQLFGYLKRKAIKGIPLLQLIDTGATDLIDDLLKMHPKILLEEARLTIKEYSEEEQKTIDPNKAASNGEESQSQVNDYIKELIDQIPKHHDVLINRDTCVEHFCSDEGTTKEELDFLAIVIEGYLKANNFNFVSLNDVWEGALFCDPTPHKSLMKVLYALNPEKSPKPAKYKKLVKYPQYSALLSVYGVINEVVKIGLVNTECPLSAAIQDNDLDLVHSLLNNGADPNIKIKINGKEKTLLALAFEAEKYEMATALVNAGAHVDSLSLSPLRFCLEHLDVAYAAAQDQQNDIVLKKNAAFIKCISTFMTSLGVSVLNQSLADGTYQGKTVIQVIIENQWWGLLLDICRFKIDLSTPFSSGIFEGLTPLQSIVWQASKLPFNEESIQPDLNKSDSLSTSTFRSALEILAYFSKGEEFSKPFPNKYSEESFLTVLHLILSINFPISWDILQKIKDWSVLEGLQAGEDALLNCFKKFGCSSLEALSHFIFAGAHVSEALLSHFHEKLKEHYNDYTNEFYEFLLSLKCRNIFLPKEAETLLEDFLITCPMGALKLLELGNVIITSPKILQQLIGNSLMFLEDIYDENFKTSEIPVFEALMNAFPEINDKRMSVSLFRYLCSRHGSLALFLLENFHSSSLQQPNEEIVVLPSLPELPKEFYEETMVRDLIGSCVSSELLARFLCAASKKTFVASGSLFPLAAHCLGYEKTREIISSVITSESSPPRRVAAILHRFIEELNESKLEANFLAFGGSIADYQIQRADQFLISEEHLAISLDHPLIQQPDPGWNLEILEGAVIEDLTEEEVDSLCSKAVKTAFISLLNGIESFDLTIKKKETLLEVIEESLEDLLNPEDSTTAGTPKIPEDRRKTYFCILHFLSHIAVIMKNSPSELAIGHFLNLIEALALCIPRRVVETSKTFLKINKNHVVDYQGEWVLLMADLRTAIIDEIANNEADDKTQTVHTYTEILQNLGEFLALPGYKLIEDPYMNDKVLNVNVKERFFDSYIPYRLVQQTIELLKDGEMETLYKNYWLEKKERKWLGNWENNHLDLVKDFNERIGIEEAFTPSEELLKQIEDGQKKIEKVKEGQTIPKDQKGHYTRLDLHKAQGDLSKILRQHPVAKFSSQLANEGIDLNPEEIRKILEMEERWEIKKLKLKSLLRTSFRNRALNEFLWKEEEAKRTLRTEPLYEMLHELGAIRRYVSLDNELRVSCL